jgi:hypothetical protein
MDSLYRVARAAPLEISIVGREPTYQNQTRNVPLQTVNSMNHSCGWLFALVCFSATAAPDDDVYSGPQPGEPVPNFTFRQILGVEEPCEIDPVEKAGDRPLLLVFVHDVNRPAIGMTRTLTRYAQSREKDGLTTAVVLLADDVTGGEATLKRIQHAMTPSVLTGVSIDGREGPGAMGLNRSVQLTILVAKSGKVTANFTLVQPSLQADLPKIIAAIIEQVGGPMPEMNKILDRPEMSRDDPDPDRMRALLRPLIQKDATDDAVDTAAQAIEKACEEDPQVRREVGRIATTIVRSGKLENYGTARAQEKLKHWAETIGSPDAP